MYWISAIFKSQAIWDLKNENKELMKIKVICNFVCLLDCLHLITGNLAWWIVRSTASQSLYVTFGIQIDKIKLNKKIFKWK